ncbi:potassium channel protein [Burkholderiaceae bacterium DAT-1]|nr:potassium channel protein [Burkholderiaceae bacterium DAT-1]
MQRIIKQIVNLTLLVFLALCFGTVGYMMIEGWDWFDGLYMTVITVATIGYGEVHPLSHAGRMFTMLLILFGTGVVLYAIAALTAVIVEGKLADEWRKIRMQTVIDRLTDHVIVCGYGSTGRYVVEELLKTGTPFVVIETDPTKLRELRERHVLCVEGDATVDDSLLASGVKRAKGLIASLHTDADNVFVVLSGKALNGTMRIIAKAIEEPSRQKLRTVGADGVVMPNFIGGLRMVSELVRPSFVTLLDMMLPSHGESVRAEEIGLPHDSVHIGKRISDLGLQSMSGVALVSLQRAQSQTHLFNPPGDTRLEAGDTLMFMGESARMTEVLDRLAAKSK